MFARFLLALTLAFAPVGSAFAQRTRDLPPATSVNSADLLAIVQGGVDKRTTIGAVSGTGTVPSQTNNTIMANTSGTTASPTGNTLTQVLNAAACTAQGSILYKSATSWVCLAPGTAGLRLTTLGTGADPQWQATSGGSVTAVTAGAGLSGGTITTTGTISATTNSRSSGFTFIIDGGGSAITTTTCSFTSGQLCAIEVPFGCTISAARMFADQTGSAVIEVAKTTYASYAPGTAPAAAGKITSTTPPTISAAAKSENTTLTDWTTAVTAGDILAVSVTSAATITRLTVSFTCVKT